MEKVEALRSIAYDLVEYIQKKVKVDFDNAGQMPFSFLFAGKTHRVGEVLGRFKTRETSPANAFLVCWDGDEVYFLYFHPYVPDQRNPMHGSCWVLCFRILTDGELMVLVAALAEPKERIFGNLRTLLAQQNRHVPIIYRTYTGMRAVLYEPVSPTDTKGFRTVKKVFPTGRVNNTTIFAQLEE